MIHPDMPADADANFKDQDVGDPVTRCDGKDPSKFKVRVVKHDHTGWTKIYRANSQTHEVASETSSATRDEVLDAANLSFHGDILASNMHTLFKKGDEGKSRPPPVGIQAENYFGDNHVLIDDLCAALKASRRPPAAVILIGCYTQPLLAKIIAVGVGAAFGIAPDSETDPRVPFPSSAFALAAADAVTSALMLGQTLNQAAQAGTDAVTPKTQNAFVSSNVRVVVEYGSNDPNKSLQDNHLLFLKPLP